MIELEPTALVLLLMVGLFTKHFIVDFLLQPPYQYLNKGTYGHPGGILHSSLHALGTWVCLVILGCHNHIWLAVLADGLLHYHIDWAKVQLTRAHNYACNTHNEFWMLVGFDQYLHALTYIAIASLVVCF